MVVGCGSWFWIHAAGTARDNQCAHGPCQSSPNNAPFKKFVCRQFISHTLTLSFVPPSLACEYSALALRFRVLPRIKGWLYSLPRPIRPCRGIEVSVRNRYAFFETHSVLASATSSDSFHIQTCIIDQSPHHSSIPFAGPTFPSSRISGTCEFLFDFWAS
jgi:hypothetical protein